MRYPFFMAWKHLTKRRRKGFVSLISLISITGVALGVMALIVVMAVMSGFDRELQSKIVGVNPHLIIQKPEGIQNVDTMIDQISSLDPRFHSIAPYVQGQVIIRSAASAIGSVARGIEPENDQFDFVKKYIMTGTLMLKPSIYKEKPIQAVAIGSALANFLRVKVGDVVYLISPQFTEEKGFTGKSAKTEMFYVGGIFEVGMYDFDNQLVLMPIAPAQNLFNIPGRVSGLSIKLKDVNSAENLKGLLSSQLGFSYIIKSWQDLNRNFFSALKVEKAVMRILLTLIVMVAAFNIVSTLIMVVMEKTKEIGILRALGATRTGIKIIFLLEGFSIGAFGTALGGVAGYYLAKHINWVATIVERFTGLEVFPRDIYYFSEIPVQIIPSDIFFVILFALLMALFAGLYPAHQAGKVSPVEAIRYE